jgi:adhesin transport system membrane fusion protein
MVGREEFEFANDIRAAMETRAPRFAWVTASAIASVLVVGLIWAQWASIEEVTSGSGRVIP